MSLVETITLAVNDAVLRSPARKKLTRSTAVSGLIVAVLTPAGSVAVHLNGVLRNAFATPQ